MARPIPEAPEPIKKEEKEKKVWMQYQIGVGYFWGPGHPSKENQPVEWPVSEKK